VRSPRLFNDIFGLKLHEFETRFIGALFGLDVANVCRIIRKLEPILSQVMKLPKRTGLQPDEEEEYNMVLSRIRVKVENVLAKVKVFKIMVDRYRNNRSAVSVIWYYRLQPRGNLRLCETIARYV
jgi:hypothetical protein